MRTDQARTSIEYIVEFLCWCMYRMQHGMSISVKVQKASM